MFTTTPFSGFYESIHSYNLERELESSFSDDSGIPYEKLLDIATSAMDWKKAHATYALEYVKTLAHELKIELAFGSLDSPREYNFSTDAILCTISEAEVKNILGRVDVAIFDKVCAENLTSRSGFVSFHPADWRQWGPIAKWAPACIGLLIEALIETEEYEEFLTHLMDDACGNGAIENIVFGAMGPAGHRAANITYYLRRRAERA